MVAGRHALHRQGHHALPLRPLAGDAVGRRSCRRRARCSGTASCTSRRRRPASSRRSASRSATSSSRWTSSPSSAPRRSAITSCANARSPATASSAGSASRRSTTPTWPTTSATSTAGCVTLISKNYGGSLHGHGRAQARAVIGTEQTRRRWCSRCSGTSRRASTTRPWKRSGGRSSTRPTSTPIARSRGSWSRPTRTRPRKVLFDLAEPLRPAAILLKPFVPRLGEDDLRELQLSAGLGEGCAYQDVWQYPGQKDDFRVNAALEKGKDKSLFPKID